MTIALIPEAMPDPTKTTPANILEQCQQILKQRGQLRDADEQALENSFGLAADLYNQIFAGSEIELSAKDIIEVMISLKLARFTKAHQNGKRDDDSILDLMVYLAFWLAEHKNHY